MCISILSYILVPAYRRQNVLGSTQHTRGLINLDAWDGWMNTALCMQR